MIKVVVKDELKEVINSVNKAQDTADRALLECNEISKRIERISYEISNLKKNVTSLQKNNAELTQHMLKCEVNLKRKNVIFNFHKKRTKKM